MHWRLQLWCGLAGVIGFTISMGCEDAPRFPTQIKPTLENVRTQLARGNLLYAARLLAQKEGKTVAEVAPRMDDLQVKLRYRAEDVEAALRDRDLVGARQIHSRLTGKTVDESRRAIEKKVENLGIRLSLDDVRRFLRRYNDLNAAEIYAQLHPEKSLAQRQDALRMLTTQLGVVPGPREVDDYIYLGRIVSALRAYRAMHPAVDLKTAYARVNERRTELLGGEPEARPSRMKPPSSAAGPIVRDPSGARLPARRRQR